MEEPTEEAGIPADVPSWSEKRAKSPGTIPSLRRAQLGYSRLNRINLARADLREAYVAYSDLTGANLADASLVRANFENARLDGADLRGANFFSASLGGASLRGSILGGTVFANVDLSKVSGLEECRHDAPSSVDFASLVRSKGRIPPVFLVGCGLPHIVIEHLPSLVGMMEPIRFYSCFLSYSEKDRDLAELLHKSLISLGLRVWFAPEDVAIGSRVAPSIIEEAIRVHDKLLLVLSKNIIDSDWVKHEVEAALNRERREQRDVPFPLRLDDATFAAKVDWAADVRRSRHIADFTKWKGRQFYDKAVSRLARGLALASAAEVEARDA